MIATLKKCHGGESKKPATPAAGERSFTIALTGNPNAGKSSLFNLLTGLRTRTGNFSGTTVEYHVGRLKINDTEINLVDLPGMYSMHAVTTEERVARDVLQGDAADVQRPDAAIVIVDADNLERNLFLVSQMLELGLPIIVALNMVDVAQRHEIYVDTEKLSAEIGCPVMPIVAKSGKGVEALEGWLEDLARDGFTQPAPKPIEHVPACAKCASCKYGWRYSWAEEAVSRCVKTPGVAKGRVTERIDRVMTHPIGGLAALFFIMTTVFYLIFSVATVPMDMIDMLFGTLGAWVSNVIPAGDLRSLLVDGIIGGVGGVLVFLPQICILFFFLAVLEDTGYLSRAAFVLDRIMRRFGLPGTAFVPLVSAHACAIPAIMSTRVIHDPRDRLIAILVAPLMTCSARLPVYTMVAALLFADRPEFAALLFIGAYMLGIVAALTTAFVLRKTILPGESKPLVMELPGYKIPSLRTVLLTTFDRAKIFVQQAGTIILVISIILWALATYPKSDPPARSLDLEQQAVAMAAQGDTEGAEALTREAKHETSRYALEHSFAGSLGKLIEPVVAPLGFDWQIGIGVISSFAAREVIVSTLSIVYGLGDDVADDNPEGLYGKLMRATRSDGTPVFTTATAVSLLIFYVLAMQCLPTQVVTMRETGSWKWAAIQFGYMTVLAYVAAFVAYQGLHLIGIA
ncbi:MAG: ferrous iron transport protein B [Verrucomicrobia bacterium]|nr:ferrous iron transport protein B [Verrucomicrobiota bacterium]MDA1085437.1 ferrous iron transport protein B [Verrucomicrobiota bacterium]